MADLQQGRQHPGDDLLLDVALGQADLPTRHDVGDHLVGCTRCRASYDELAGGLELVLAAVPRVAPPPDFEQAVLKRLDERNGLDPTGGAARASVARVPDRRRSSSRSPAGSAGRRSAARRWLVPVAAGLVGLAAGAGLTAVVLDDPPSQAITAGIPIVTGDGERVGSVTRTIAAGEPALVVAVDHGPAGLSYTCRVVLADGSVEDVAEWELRADGVNSWVVADPGAQRVELVAPSGQVWSSADL